MITSRSLGNLGGWNMGEKPRSPIRVCDLYNTRKKENVSSPVTRARATPPPKVQPSKVLPPCARDWSARPQQLMDDGIC
jgi:hypothetical protein